MMKGSREPGFEAGGSISVLPPALESLVQPSTAEASWLKRVASNKEFSEQVTSRRELNERLDAVLSRLPRPDVSLPEAISNHDVTERQAADLYASLTPLLARGSEYQRIALYLPFELLPDAGWEPSSEPLKQAIARFKAAYMDAWNRLLSTQDVRANFVDGDVLEVERRTGDLPRVVKAAHLIPKLVEKGLIGTEDVLLLMETAEDDILRQSIADTLPVLADMGRIRAPELERIRASKDACVREKAARIASSMEQTDAREPKTIADVTAASIRERLRRDAERIASEDYGDVSDRRRDWLKQEDARKSIESAGDDIGAAIAGNALRDEEAARLASPETDGDSASRLALVNGIRKAVESAAHAGAAEGRARYAKYRETLLSLWKRKDPGLNDAISKTFCRLHGLDVVDDKQLNALGITIPAVAGPFSKNMEMMEEEIGDIKQIVAAVERNPELSKLIYPVVLIYGSRVKGYGTKTADLDVGVFIKPGTPPGNGARVRELLHETFTHEKIHGGDVIEFWLEETEDGLSVRDDDEVAGPTVGDSSWTYMLFGAAWEGNAGAIKALREQLLVPYFYDTDKRIHGRDARGLYLEELERDSLQYRLMHKGYERFFPSYGGINTPHAGEIDGTSAFWDSGYRQTATKLYASRVFLPKISG